MVDIEDIRRIAADIREHEKHHIDGACHAPSMGICPKPEMHADLASAWGELAIACPEKYGWAKFRDRIAPHLPGGEWENEIPTIGWGQCESCGAVGPVFYLAGGRETCIRCLEDGP